MGSVIKRVTKTFKKVTKPITKIAKGIAKGIAKVGKAIGKGLAKVSQKFGPLGSIALAMAMPYALGGLSTAIGIPGGATGWMNSSNLFLKSIGNVGNAIRSGYTGITGSISRGIGSITKNITTSFQKFAPKGNNNIWSRISQGAKNLYNSAKRVSQKYSPFKGKQGTIGVDAEALGLHAKDGIIQMDSASLIRDGKLMVSPDSISKQTLGSNKWFVQGSSGADKIVSDTINEAWKSNLDGYSNNAMRYFNDLKAHSKKIGTYVNDAEVGSIIENSRGATKSLLTDFDTIPQLDVNFAKSGDFTALNEEGTEYIFNGNKSFDNKIATDMKYKPKNLAKKAVTTIADSLLKANPEEIEIPEVPEWFNTQGATSNDGHVLTSSTNIAGSTGTTFFEKVFGARQYNALKNHHKRMNYIA